MVSYKCFDLKFAERMLAILTSNQGRGFIRHNPDGYYVFVKDFGLFGDNGDFFHFKDYMLDLVQETQKSFEVDMNKTGNNNVFDTYYLDKALNFKKLIKLHGGKARLYVIENFADKDYLYLFRVKVEKLGRFPNMQSAREVFRQKYG